MKKVYLFGNIDTELDNKALKIIEKLKNSLKFIEFIEVGTNKDLPFANKEDVIILDTISNIDKVMVLTTDDIERLDTSANKTVHDFDLGFQLKYLQKIGKLGKITIIGIPQKGKLDYFLIQSILRRFVAQDMQGS